MSSQDTEYYRQRAIDERAMALKAERRDFAANHEELARQYQALVDNAELQPLRRFEMPVRQSAQA